MKKLLLFFIAVFLLGGCTSTLSPIVKINDHYGRFNSASIQMNCQHVRTDNINPDSIPDFCQMLQTMVKVSLRSKYDIKITDDKPDFKINLKIEEIYGGNAQTRFWVGFGAGKSAITTFVNVTKDDKSLAEGRLIETSTMPNLNSGMWSNEEVISQDIIIISNKIANFIIDPVSYAGK
jgi:hypothetical protein